LYEISFNLNRVYLHETRGSIRISCRLEIATGLITYDTPLGEAVALQTHVIIHRAESIIDTPRGVVGVMRGTAITERPTSPWRDLWAPLSRGRYFLRSTGVDEVLGVGIGGSVVAGGVSVVDVLAGSLSRA